MLDTVSNPLQNDQVPSNNQTREPQSGDTDSELLNLPIPKNLSEMNCGEFIDWASNSIPKHGREKLFQSDITELISKLMAKKGVSAEDLNKLEDDELREKIASMHYVDFCWFARNFNINARQYDLSQVTVDTMVEKYLQFADEYAQTQLEIELRDRVADGQGSHYSRMIIDSALGEFAWGGFKLTPQTRPDGDRLNVADQITKAMVSQTKKGTHLNAVEKYLNLDLLQNPQMIQDEVLYEAVMEVGWLHSLSYPQNNRDAVSAIKDDFFGWSVYNIAFGFDRFKQFFEQKASELIETNHIADLAKLIEMAKIIGRSSAFEGYDSAERASFAIADMIQALVLKTNNYLLRQRALNAYDEIVGELQWLNDAVLVDVDAQEDAVDRALHEIELHYTPEQIDDWINSTEDERHESEITKRYVALIAVFEAAEASFHAKKPEQQDSYPNIQAIVGDHFIVSPISPKHIGIYNNQGVLERFVDVADASYDRPRIRELHELELFVHGTDEREGTIERHNQTQDTMLLLSMPFRKAIENDFGVTLSNLDVRVQQYFLNYIKVNAESTVLNMAEYAQKYGENFFTAFLSLEEGGEMGQVIERVCQKYDHETVASIFAKYAELVRTSEQTRHYIRQNFGAQLETNSDLENEIVEQLLKRGKDILVYAASAPDQIDVVQYLEGAKTEIIMFANTFRTLKAHGERVDLEQFKGVHIERIVGLDLADEIKQQLSAISAANWANHGL